MPNHDGGRIFQLYEEHRVLVDFADGLQNIIRGDHQQSKPVSRARLVEE
jgi:hypothetical protein